MIEYDAPTTEFEAFASIHGMFVPDALLREGRLVELEPGTEIVELDAETQSVMYQTETIRRVSGFRWSDQFFAVRVQYSAPADGDARERARDRTNQVLRTALDCLRLHQPGRIYYGGTIHRAVSRVGAIEIFHSPWPENPAALYPLADQGGIDGLARLWTLMRSRPARERQSLALAIRWFSHSADVARLEDWIISLMTSAEALFQVGKGSKGAQIAAAAAALQLPSLRGEDVTRHLIDSYELRNEVLHEGHAGGWRPTAGRRLSADELAEFVLLTSMHVRAAVRTTLERVVGPSEPPTRVA